MWKLELLSAAGRCISKVRSLSKCCLHLSVIFLSGCTALAESTGTWRKAPNDLEPRKCSSVKEYSPAGAVTLPGSDKLSLSLFDERDDTVLIEVSEQSNGKRVACFIASEIYEPDIAFEENFGESYSQLLAQYNREHPRECIQLTDDQSKMACLTKHVSSFDKELSFIFFVDARSGRKAYLAVADRALAIGEALQ